MPRGRGPVAADLDRARGVVDPETTLQAPLGHHCDPGSGVALEQSEEASLDRGASVRPLDPALGPAFDAIGEDDLPEHDLAPLDLEAAFAPLDAHVVVVRKQEIAVLAPRRRRRGPLDRQWFAAPAQARPGSEPLFDAGPRLRQGPWAEPAHL